MKYSLALFLALATTVQAATIAVIDSGVDYNHQQLAHKMWKNPSFNFVGEFPRVINGWNFIDNNNQIFTYSDLSKFSSDVFRYFEVESRYNAGTLTEDDKKFLSEKLSNNDFNAMISSYGGFAHGTHVAGIAARNESHKVMGLKYIKVNINSVLKTLKSSKSKFSDEEKKLNYFLAYIAKSQSSSFAGVIKFLDIHPADVANGSYGSPFRQIQNIANKAFIEVYKREPIDEESFKTAYILQYFIIESYRPLVSKSKNTLYVFSAGNDSSNNDIFPMSPANLNLDNTISVAATHGNVALAKFSNYGAKTVDVAAPGVNIVSSAPGTSTIAMSGTSQSAPMVSRIAGKIKDINSELTPAQVKKILMETVDKKAFLKGKVRSGGIVNEKRALKAAELSLNLNLSRAIYEANTIIAQSPQHFLVISADINENPRHVELPSIYEL